MTKPIIGITPFFEPDTGFYRVRENFTRAIEKAGGVPFILPLSRNPEILDPFLNLVDGLLFSGGHDIETRHYCPIDKKMSGLNCPVRDEMELYLFQEALKRDLPVLGICRGMQMINVASGGDLYQDIGSELKNTLQHYVTSKSGQGLISDDENDHFVQCLPATELSTVFGSGKLHVNSYHHQAVQHIPPCLEPLAVSEDGIIEAIKHREASWILGVQWHPEMLFDEEREHFYFFKKLIDESRGYIHRKQDRC